MSKIKMMGKGSPALTAALLMEKLPEECTGVTLADSVNREMQGVSLSVMVFEKLFMRSMAKTSLTVTLTGCGDIVYADLIASGGTAGGKISFSFGSQEEFLAQATAILERQNFKILS